MTTAGHPTLASDEWRATRPFFHPWLDPGGPEVLVIDVLEGDRHHSARAVDRHLAEELQPEAGRQVVALRAAAPLLEDRARTERVVELLRSPGAGMEGAGNEFPERLEVLEHGRVGIVIMRGGVVHVGGDPDRIGDAGMLDEGEEIGDLDFAPARAAVALRDRVAAHHADRQIGGDDFPSRLLGVAFEQVCLGARIGDCDDDVKQAIANKIIELAKTGERNPDLLCERALKDIRQPA